MSRELTAAQRRRRRKRARDRELRQLGRAADAKITAAEQQLAVAKEGAQGAESGVSDLNAKLGAAKIELDMLRQRLAVTAAELGQARSDLSLAQNTVALTNRIVVRLEGEVAQLRHDAAESAASLDKKANELATLKIRAMHPEWRKRMLAKNSKIAELSKHILDLNNLRDLQSERKVAMRAADAERNIKLRDQIIVMLYFGLKWCSERDEMKAESIKADWDKTIQPILDRMEPMIKRAPVESVAQTESIPQAPEQQLVIQQDAEASA